MRTTAASVVYSTGTHVRLHSARFQCGDMTVGSPAEPSGCPGMMLRHCCTVAVQGNLWKRKGWKEMDKMRSKLEDLKELRDLVGACRTACTIDRLYHMPHMPTRAQQHLVTLVFRNASRALCAVMSHRFRRQVRSLGRGGGWGPLRRAPIQHLDMKGRPGLLRTVLEQQETRGLTRADDLSRLLPSEVPGPSNGYCAASHCPAQ